MLSFNKALVAIFLQSVDVLAAPLDIATPAQATPVTPPESFTSNPDIGSGRDIKQFKESNHFVVYNAPEPEVTAALDMLEGAYSCFVGSLGWRSSGLSINDAEDDGPWTKVNVYTEAELPPNNATGLMNGDEATGISWLQVRKDALTAVRSTVHEFGHALTYAEKTWVDQTQTGAWWETLANWVADTYATSPLCDGHRPAGAQTNVSLFTPGKIISDSYQIIVDGTAETGNYYEAWPLLSYLTLNPDNHPGFGRDTVREMLRQYRKEAQETPLHTLARMSKGAPIQQIIGRYWARMAYVDIGHPAAQALFMSLRSLLNYDNLDALGGGVYRIRPDRSPRYLGASIIPLKTAGNGGPVTCVTAQLAVAGPYTAALAVYDASCGATRYVDFINGFALADVTASEEVTVVVANTPPELVQYDPFQIDSAMDTGMDFNLTLTGATA